MNSFLEATRVGLRVPTSQGPLSVEQLWGLPLSKLANAIKNVKKSLKGTEDDDELSFLDESKTVDKIQQLTFDVLKDIYMVKKEEATTAKNAASVKANNEKIMAMIHQKQESALGDKSIEELTAMLIQ